MQMNHPKSCHDKLASGKDLHGVFNEDLTSPLPPVSRRESGTKVGEDLAAHGPRCSRSTSDPDTVHNYKFVFLLQLPDDRK